MRWWRRLWLRYLHYSREHAAIAASITLTLLAWLAWLAIQLLPVLLEMMIAAV